MLWLSTDIDSRVAYIQTSVGDGRMLGEAADTPVDQAMVLVTSSRPRWAMLFEGRPAAWTFRANVVIDWRRIVVGLLSGCSLKDSREDDQNQTDIFRVRGV